MKFAFFQGCNIPARIEQYSQSATELLSHLGVELVTVKEFNCCGYPMRNIDEKSYLLPSLRNLALAEKMGLEIMVLCNCCFHSLQKARHMAEKEPEVLAELNTILAKEGLHYSGKAQVVHFLSLLHSPAVLQSLKDKVVYHLQDLQIALLHGCHLLRPREVTRFDNTFFPTIASEITDLVGITSLDWHGSLECCGAPLAGINDELSLKLLSEKVINAKKAGADCIVPLCSYCYLQLEGRQNHTDTIEVLLFPQLLGLCMGLDPQRLGFEKNKAMSQPFIEELLKRLIEPPVKKKRRKKVAA